MQIQYLAIESLKPHPRNAHTHSTKQIDALAESIRRFGFVSPIVADENRTILAGHGRWQAAREAGLTLVPVVQVENLSAFKKRGLMLADNKIAEQARWDRDLLAVELADLSEGLVAEGLDVSIAGFSAPEIARITAVSSSDPAEAIDSRWLSERPVSTRDDLWILGPHRIMCADAHDRNALTRLMREDCTAMAFLDPFGHGEVDAAREGLVQHLAGALGAAAAVSLDGAVHYVCAPWRHIGQLLEAGQRVYGAALNLVVWIKSDDVDEGPLYSNQHALIGVFCVGGQPHLKIRKRRLRSNVWRYAAPDQFQTGLSARPVAMVADAIKDVTRKGDIVIDTFARWGTTIIAAERVGRRCYALERQPRLVDASVRRWQVFAGRSAIHAETGRSFDELARKRQDARADLG